MTRAYAVTESAICRHCSKPLLDETNRHLLIPKCVGGGCKEAALWFLDKTTEELKKHRLERETTEGE